MESVKETRCWSSFDAIKGLLSFFPDKPIPSSTPVLHSAISKLLDIEQYKTFLSEYIFEHRSYFPFSRELHLDLQNLEQSGLLSAENPDFVDYNVKPKLKKTFNLYTKNLFSPEELEILKKMSEDFQINLKKD